MSSIIKDSAKLIASEYNNGQFKPLLEDDLLGRVYYHCLLNNYDSLAENIFLKANILHNIKHLNRQNKYDLVIGKNEGNKFVIPEIIVEFKVFMKAFSPSQLSKRRDGVIKDIEKLNLVHKHFDNVKLFIFCFDEISWLTGYNLNDSKNRLESFISFRNSSNENLKIIGLRCINKKAEYFEY